MTRKDSEDKPGKKRSSKKKYIIPILIVFGNLRTVSAGYQANN